MTNTRKVSANDLHRTRIAEVLPEWEWRGMRESALKLYRQQLRDHLADASDAASAEQKTPLLLEMDEVKSIPSYMPIKSYINH